MPSPTTPIIIGVGQFTERVGDPGYRALAPVAVAAEAAQRACDDAGSLTRLAPHIDTLAVVPTFDDSSPRLAQPFGRPLNFPRSLAARLGAAPARAIWTAMGGHMPQRLLNRCSEAIASGAMKLALLTGAEAISTARHLADTGAQADWHEEVAGAVEDERSDWDALLTEYELAHDLWAAPPLYALCEHARRGRLGLDRATYLRAMGELFATLSSVAAANPHAASHRAFDAAELITPSATNRLIADPYPRRLVARDQVNQGAAVLLASVGMARALGIPETQWIYLHGYADADERPLLERTDLGDSPAARWALQQALAASGVAADDLDLFDLYSCFPIAVSNACEGLGIGPADPRPLTVTGGLPFFGGPGNNYSMHAIASMVERLRAAPAAYGLVGANGGFLSKYSVGIYSAQPGTFHPVDSHALQARIDALPAPRVERRPRGPGTIETYTVLFDRDCQPVRGIIIGRQPDGARFLAVSADHDRQTPQQLTATEPLGRTVEVTVEGERNCFVLSLPVRP